MRVIGAVLLLVVVACADGSPPSITDVTLYLAQSVCTDGTPAVLSPGCVAHQQTGADPMLWRRWDWAHSDGAQIEDAYRRDIGSGFVNSFSYPPHGPFVAANGDGGDLLVTDGTTVRIDYTQAGAPGGGTIAGWWVGPRCGGTGWLAFDQQTPTGRWKSAVALLAGSTDPNACPLLNTAYTQWRRETATVPILVSGAPQSLLLPVIVSEHYAGSSIVQATSMERFVMAAGVGRVLWEAWGRSPSGYNAGANCPGIVPWSNSPGPNWVLHDRRCITSYQRTDGAMTGNRYGWPP